MPNTTPYPLLRTLMQRTCGPLWFCLALLLPLGAQAKGFSGLIYPLHDITLSAGVSGLVMKRVVLLGQAVKADQLLLQLDDRLQSIESNRRRVIFEDQSELQATRDRLRILDTLLQDTRAVFNRTGSISKDELLRLEAEQLASQGRLAQLVEQKKREQLDYASAERDRLQRHITAPISGVVTKIIPQVGEWAKAGDPMLHLVDSSVAILRLAVPHNLASALKVGSQQLIRLESGSSVAEVTGQIKFVSPVADPASGLVQVEVNFSNPGRRIKTGIKGMIDIAP
ncbi:efflux RND transporter periplasmic adaptor subunit [Rhodoferax sp.]|uniref:efflux RND transporter periplasmic adaptor subunit n=1 Tax=Rhodoferax sp. TaxID=50421 RepID=UPI00268BB846|nr:efflux RND transporter periplasmic adaptor subunit [Rhodoferax sp.]MDO8319764.1 efflux RND transporter periplasmic adaptor subunit [Rhodoferax sp.]MDP2679198.1 efflux RND transporter periplasmic adaptor subunit [Rhodoferax sp.]